MPLIINELITHIESPQDSAVAHPIAATGANETAQQVTDAMAINKEREERLKID